MSVSVASFVNTSAPPPEGPHFWTPQGVLDILVQARRNQEAAETFLRRVVDGCGYQPRGVITDKLAS